MLAGATQDPWEGLGTVEDTPSPTPEAIALARFPYCVSDDYRCTSSPYRLRFTSREETRTGIQLCFRITEVPAVRPCGVAQCRVVLFLSGWALPRLRWAFPQHTLTHSLLCVALCSGGAPTQRGAARLFVTTSARSNLKSVSLVEHACWDISWDMLLGHASVIPTTFKESGCNPGPARTRVVDA